VSCNKATFRWVQDISLSFASRPSRDGQ
jgi:hypothetical protein